MKTPRDVSSERFIRHCVKHWDYRIDRQSGSHILVESETPTRHSIPILNRSAIGIGLFRAILSQVSAAKGVAVEEILRGFWVDSYSSPAPLCPARRSGMSART